MTVRPLRETGTHSDALTFKLMMREYLRADTMDRGNAVRVQPGYKPYHWIRALFAWEHDHADLSDYNWDRWEGFVHGNLALWQLQVNDRAGLIWVDSDTINVINELAHTVPEPQDLTDLCLPGPHGFVVLAKPVNLDSERDFAPSDATTNLAALGWSLGVDRNTQRMTFYVEPWFEIQSDHAGLVQPAPACWIDGYGPRTPRVLDDGTEFGWNHPMQYPLRWVAALAGYCAGKVEITDEHAPDRPTRKMLKRAGIADAKVSVVKMRRAVRSDSERDESVPTGKTIGHDKRWIVRGHWRNQPCGPGRSRRRHVWISPYVKGNPDAPMVQGVQKLWNVSR